ncbi:glycine cleavage system protein GcvH [Candidiatus Paracoxiella cheracis]|uniref:glycine cleavage system protein GcvH n=1 Tax=Candidiatus Paracoxiella cheracis TaxID=3405120 RepID=UPI003BF511B0
MAEFPKELRYSDSHEWVRVDDDDVITVGITDHAQSQLGDLVFVELPDADAHIEAGDEAAVVESVKTAADVYSPVTGEVIEVNEALQSDPALVNHDPYGDGWLFRVKVDDIDEIKTLLDAESYEAKVTED